MCVYVHVCARVRTGRVTFGRPAPFFLFLLGRPRPRRLLTSLSGVVVTVSGEVVVAVARFA